VVELEGISKSFLGPDGPVHAVRDVSLEVEPGAFVALHGPSGSGKTTLLLIAGALLHPDKGTVAIAGERPYELGQNERSTLRAVKIGFVFQQHHLVPYLNVLDNVLTASLAKPQGGIQDRAKELLRQVKLEHRLRHFPAQLSTGEQQRVALARAVLNDPEVILADEPTGNLDEENGKAVLTFLAQHARDGRAVLVISHDAEVAGMANKRIEIREGAISGSVVGRI